LNAIDVISVRLWLDKTVNTRTPANVFAKFDALRGAGGTFFMLEQFQTENVQDLWGGEEVQGSVVACDFYNAGALLALPDEKIVEILMRQLLPRAVEDFYGATVVDSWVGKFPEAVTWFSPASLNSRPKMQGYSDLSRVKFAGDVVTMGDREHGAKGLCQERALVSGLQAAEELIREIEGGAFKSARISPKVIPIRDDEKQFKIAAAINNKFRKFTGIKSI